MDRHQYLVNEYQLILTLSEQMLTLAKDEKWDELVELEMTYLKAVEASTQLPLTEEISLAVRGDPKFKKINRCCEHVELTTRSRP